MQEAAATCSNKFFFSLAVHPVYHVHLREFSLQTCTPIDVVTEPSKIYRDIYTNVFGHYNIVPVKFICEHKSKPYIAQNNNINICALVCFKLFHTL